MDSPLTPWQWVRRALGTATLLLLAGWAAGLAGVLTSGWVGWLLGGAGVGLGGSAWAVSRIGGAGLGAGLIGLVAAIGMNIEGQHAMAAARATIVELPSLSLWDPRSDIVALRTGELRHLRQLESWGSHRSGSGKNAHTSTHVVTPVFDDREKRVVGFHCRGANGRRGQNGAWVLSSAHWHGASAVECPQGLRLSIQKCAEAKLVVADGADRRFVEVFATEAELRGAHDLRQAAAIPMTFLLVYTVLVLLFRRHGPGSVND